MAFYQKTVRCVENFGSMVVIVIRGSKFYTERWACASVVARPTSIAVGQSTSEVLQHLDVNMETRDEIVSIEYEQR